MAPFAVVQLRTERLVLRPITIRDARAYHEYRSDPEVVAYLTHPPLDLPEARRRLAGAEGRWDCAVERFHLTFAVALEGRLIGDVSAWNADAPFQPTSPDPEEVWVGYAFNPRFQGCGYAGEAVRGLASWLFDRGASRIFANTFTDNVPSLRLLRAMGFVDHLHFTAEQDGSGRGLPSVRMSLVSSPASHLRGSRGE